MHSSFLPFVSLVVAVLPVQASQPDARLDTRVIGSAGSFDDRSAPSTYQYDAPPYVGWLTSLGREIIGVNVFDAVGGSDLLTSISCAWRGVPDDSTQRVFVWQDDGSGDIANARLLLEQSVVAANASTSTINVYPLTVPVPVSGRFYVGFSSVLTTSTGVVPFQLSSNAVPDRSLLAVGEAGFDATHPGSREFIGTTTRGFPGYFALRANGAGSSFSYQGRLTNSGTSYSGTADVLFRIYDQAENGNQISPDFTQSKVTVSGGIFTLQIPADPAWFVNAPDRYLEVCVRTPESNGDFTTLTPRQRIGQVPASMVATLAQSALTAQSVPWNGITGVPASLGAWQSVTEGLTYAGGRVGIGTGSPSALLHVVGGPAFATAQFESNFGNGTWMNLANSSANGRLWSLVSTGATNTEGPGALLIRDNSAGVVRATFLPSGRVGLGTTSPTAALDVRGNIRLGASGEYQAAAGQVEALATIRGVINTDGTIRHGAGFTVTRQGVGNYRITWSTTPGFADYPAFAGNATFTLIPTILWVSEGYVFSDRSGYVVVRTVNASSTPIDCAFSFTLTGPR